MLSLGRLRLQPDTERINLFLIQASPVILTSLTSLVIFHGYLLIQQSNGGSDLVSADIPKSLMLLNGQNPYSTQPWASPYPPLLLLTVSGIVRLTSLFASQSSLDLISQQIRFIGLFADAAVALIIYLTIRTRTNNPLQALIPASLFLSLPAVSSSPLYFFHSDTFGYPILALAGLTLAKQRYLTGTILLATATIFKIHPVLALPLVMIWLIRTQGLLKTLPSLFATTIITSLGLILPLAIPGYQQSILGFNLTNQGNGTTLTIMSLLNTILPQTLQFAPTELYTNQIWITTAATLYTIILGTVWTKARSLSLIDVVLLGLVAWLIPLKIVYTHYILWSVIQTDNSRSWTPPIRRHARLLVIIPRKRPLPRHRRFLRTRSDEPSHTDCRSNSTSSCTLLAEEESYGRLSTSKLTSFNCILTYRQHVRVVRWRGM